MNKNTRFRAAGIAAAIILVVIIIFAVRTAPSQDSMDHSGHGMGNETASGDDDVNRYLQRQDEIMMDMMQAMESIPKSGNASIDFLQGMIPHHESAVAMAESYLEYSGESGALKELAQNIISTQSDEMKHMSDLIQKYKDEGHSDADRENAYLEEYDQMLDHDHEMAESGTDSLDHAFAEGMIMHHEMAVDMAESILEYTDYEEVKALAQTITDTQKKEIEEMRRYIPEQPE